MPQIQVGDKLIWEPGKPHTEEVIEVTQIEGDWVETSGKTGAHWNEMSRVREACVRAGND